MLTFHNNAWIWIYLSCGWSLCIQWFKGNRTVLIMTQETWSRWSSLFLFSLLIIFQITWSILSFSAFICTISVGTLTKILWAVIGMYIFGMYHVREGSQGGFVKHMMITWSFLLLINILLPGSNCYFPPRNRFSSFSDYHLFCLDLQIQQHSETQWYFGSLFHKWKKPPHFKCWFFPLVSLFLAKRRLR